MMLVGSYRVSPHRDDDELYVYGYKNHQIVTSRSSNLSTFGTISLREIFIDSYGHPEHLLLVQFPGGEERERRKIPERWAATDT